MGCTRYVLYWHIVYILLPLGTTAKAHCGSDFSSHLKSISSQRLVQAYGNVRLEMQFNAA